jgi:hypothetical protein
MQLSSTGFGHDQQKQESCEVTSDENVNDDMQL